MSSIFVKPKFNGTRFDNHTLPVSVASDLAAYEALLIDVAKYLYLKDHPDRQRVPKGFTDVHLDIMSIEEGSVIPALQLVSAAVLSSQLVLYDGGDSQRHYLEHARDLVAECIQAPASSLPPNFPKDALIYFNKLGRSLREGETLELYSANGKKTATLTSEKRKELVLAINAVYEREVELSGYIEEIDTHRHSLRLRIDDNIAVSIIVPEDYINNDIKLALGKDRHHIIIKGIAQYDSQEKLQKIMSYQNIELIKNYKLVNTLDSLLLLNDGWFNGKGKAPDKTKLKDIMELLIQHYPESIPLPTIFPTQDGNILLEWQTDSMPSVDIDIDSKKASFHAFGEQDIDVEQDFFIASSDDMQQFFSFLSDNV